MFGFLKNKLKEWTQGVKDKLKVEETPEENTEEKEEVKEEEKKVEEKKIEIKKEEKKEKPTEVKKVEKKKEEIIQPKEKPKKEKKVEKEVIVIKEPEIKEEVKQEIKEDDKIDQKIVDELIQEAKAEKTETVPVEFNPALEKYVPDTNQLKKDLKEKQEKKIEEKEEVVKEEEIEKQEIKVVEEKLEEKKESFFGKIGKIFKKKEETIEEKQVEVKEELKKEDKEIEKIEEDRDKLVKESDLLKLEPELEPLLEKEIEEAEKKPEKKSFFKKLKESFIYKITEESFDDIFDDLEMLLLENNAALEVVEDIKKILAKKLIGKEIKKDDLEKVISNGLKEALNELIIEPVDPLDAIKKKKEKNLGPFVILFFGINGTGKTTSIAKIANLMKKNNLSVVLAAGDTFRAASIEQIQEHANRLDVPLIKHDYEGDPSAVGFDAIKYAKTHHIDVVLIDTAGRMHTKTNLIAEMEKICRVTNPDLKVFVAESIAGNDATEQAKTFNEAIGIDGSILSKADVDEKGGTIISVSHVTKKPIFYLGTGQNYDDIKLFNKNEYIGSLGL